MLTTDIRTSHQIDVIHQTHNVYSTIYTIHFLVTWISALHLSSVWPSYLWASWNDRMAKPVGQRVGAMHYIVHVCADMSIITGWMYDLLSKYWMMWCVSVFLFVNHFTHWMNEFDQCRQKTQCNHAHHSPSYSNSKPSALEYLSMADIWVCSGLDPCAEDAIKRRDTLIMSSPCQQAPCDGFMKSAIIPKCMR